MQIAITKNLAKAIGVKVRFAKYDPDPLFMWTANWTNTFPQRKEDLIIMVNHATRFTVSIYDRQQNQLNDLKKTIAAAIRHTLLALNLNPEFVDEYIRQAGEMEFVSNHDRQVTAWLNHQSENAVFVVRNKIKETGNSLKSENSLGAIHSMDYVMDKQGELSIIPANLMINGIAKLTDIQPYKYRAFELLVTLDLKAYQAVRRLIVPVNISFIKLHRLMQNIFNWEKSHLYGFTVYDGSQKPIAVLAAAEDVLTGHLLSEYFPKYKQIIYTYDMGYHWEHEIKLVKVIEDYDKESPRLLEGSGQIPPGNLKRMEEYLKLHKIILSPEHHGHEGIRRVDSLWKPELAKGWHKQLPKIIRI